MKSAIYLTPFLLCVAAARNTRQPTAVVNAGTVVGVATSLPSSTVTVNKFLGIPYAEPPVGSRRFLPPTPVAAFNEQPFNASQWGSICHQQNSGTDNVARESEDCLTLNVYTPARCSGTGRPVLVWIHGGNLQSGTPAQLAFDGTSFASNHDILVVTLNYRLNVFGFPNSPALALTQTNLGFLDQRLALDWVQKNIHAFGGDPAKVTIAGESSGASSVDRLVNTFAPPLKPPFRAAAESSGQATVSGVARDSGPASWAALVAALSCKGDSPAAELACVQAADAVAIRSVVNELNIDFSPVNDRVTQVEVPYLDARAAGHAAQVPLLIATSAQEGNFLAVVYGLDIATFSEAQLLDFLRVTTGGNETLVEAFYGLVQSIRQTDGLSLFHAAAQAYTELVYQCPAKLVSRATAQSGLPAWRYYNNVSFPNIQLPGYPDLGVFHTSDLSLIWGTYPAENATLREAEVSERMQAAWAGFIKDPWHAGPGWDRVDDQGRNVACFGCGSGTEVTLIDEQKVDGRCPFYEGTYQTVKTPYF
ncbi:Alpha/Beta hydrolase protein [Parachaetomium inaequale]|uniref:Carboxylic ester hydrolase n=1 Tax=Parachaetomium inaequale TaxID=2588326 RepID=A0AAN6PAI2_9PEZI|nr:Alpha/Beta hydrolase protein [Parachaetomium inaequale]